MKLLIKDFFSKCDQIRRNLGIWSHLLNKSLMENFIFCAVYDLEEYAIHCKLPANLVIFSNTLLIQLILLLFVSYYLIFIKDVAVKLRSYLGALVKSRERIEVSKIMVRLTVMAKSYLSNLSRVKAEFRWNLQLIALLFAASYFS